MASLPPLLLIPGIGGSMLHYKEKRTGKEDRAWIKTLNMDDNFKARLWSKYNEKTRVTEPLNPDIEILVPEDNHGLYSVENLDPDFPALFKENKFSYYATMTAEMRKWGYKNGKNLFGFGYDFRQSNRSELNMNRLRKKVADIHRISGKKVNIITHSMGGLITKSYLTLHKDEFADHVESWTAIAAPFRGAPALITDTLLCGPNFISKLMETLFVKKWTTHQMLEECPSVFEMITDYGYNWHEPPFVRVYFGKKGKPEIIKVKVITTQDDLLDFLRVSLKDNAVEVKGKVIPLHINENVVNWALETKKLWLSAELPKGAKFYNIYGVGNDTPFHVNYGSIKDPVDPDNVKDLLDEEGTFINVDGDGTVPYESATGDGFDAISRDAFIDTHSGIIHNPKVFELLKDRFAVKVKAAAGNVQSELYTRHMSTTRLNLTSIFAPKMKATLTARNRITPFSSCGAAVVNLCVV